MVLLHHLNPEVIKIVRKLILSDYDLENYMKIFDSEINKGLNVETCEEATVKSIVTYVNKLPTGNEEGDYIALEFVSPKIKILLVNMAAKECTVTVKIYEIPERYRSGKSDMLFKFIAKCLDNFMKNVNLKMQKIPLGVTFGFPIEQTSLQDCRLLRWSKDFQCDDMIGESVCFKLKNAIRKFPNLKNVYVIGILSDTVSALLACAWQDPNCKIGVVVGHGASCCYAEKVYRVTKYEAESYSIQNIYINLESGALGESGCLDDFKTEFDIQMDEASSNPGKLINEKLTSMSYIGEIARLALIACIENELILEGNVTEILATPNSFESEHMSRIESDADDQHDGCKSVLQEFGYDEVSDEDCTQIQFVCRCVSRRSAHLMAAQIATLINRIGDSEITIAADGAMIREYPDFEMYMRSKISYLKKEDCNFRIVIMEENGLGRGAAVMAAIFGEEVMAREEKLRILPPFPENKCHFKRTGRCIKPECNARNAPNYKKEEPKVDSHEILIQSLIRQCKVLK